MAYFKSVEYDETGNPIRYSEPDDIYRLIDYVCRKSVQVDLLNLLYVDQKGIANQILYLQKCYGKELSRRARHYILSFDSRGWEHEINAKQVSVMGAIICGKYFSEYQCLSVVHNNGNNLHAHIIVNPVSKKDMHILHMSTMDWNNMMKEIAIDLYSYLGVALYSISYIDEKGRLRFESSQSGYHEMYENRLYSYTPLKDKKGNITVQKK